jgi:hypothetical protein
MCPQMQLQACTRHRWAKDIRWPCGLAP